MRWKKMKEKMNEKPGKNPGTSDDAAQALQDGQSLTSLADRSLNGLS
jgi:hypothetical protein